MVDDTAGHEDPDGQEPSVEELLKWINEDPERRAALQRLREDPDALRGLLAEAVEQEDADRRDLGLGRLHVLGNGTGRRHRGRRNGRRHDDGLRPRGPHRPGEGSAAA